MNSKLWFPYAQMKLERDHIHIDHAFGCTLTTKEGKNLLDAISSWWCVIHGYSHPKITTAAQNQLHKMAHIMLGGLQHQPAIDLSEKLVDITPMGLNHVFYSDSGSVGVEVALKMARQYWKLKGEHKSQFISLKKAYHGDTWACMSVCDPADSLHVLFKDDLPTQFQLSAPGEIQGAYNSSPSTLSRTDEKSLGELEAVLKTHHSSIAAFIFEPILQAAGGFNMYSGEYLKEAQSLCKKYNVLMIADEVATGFGRTGKLFACEYGPFSPDIMVLGKGLTAGYTGMAATIASTEIFNTFLSDTLDHAFMHGPTFMGNPLACAVALESISLFEDENYLAKIKKIEHVLVSRLSTISSPNPSSRIHSWRVIGGTGVVEYDSSETASKIATTAIKNGVWLRPIGPWLYTMPPYTISENELEKVIDAILNI
jgi:adenosylmethionine-8-amino-7-oxononanoate aminotransferase